jgi:arylsulfatase
MTFASEGVGKGGEAQLLVGDRVVASGHIPKTFFTTAGVGEMLDVGRDTGVPVTDYRTPNGRLEGDVSHVALRFK